MATIKIPDLCKSDVKIDSKFIEERESLLAEAKALTIETPETYKAGNELKANVTTFLNQCEKYRKDLQRPFSDVVKTIRDTISGELVALHNAKQALQSDLNSFAAKQRHKEEQERKRREEERQKEIAKQVEQSELDAFFSDSQPEAVIEVPEPEPVKTALEGASIAEIVKFRVVNEEKISRSWMRFDPAFAKEFIRESDGLKDEIKRHDGKFVYHGVEFYIEPQVRTTTKRGRAVACKN